MTVEGGEEAGSHSVEYQLPNMAFKVPLTFSVSVLILDLGGTSCSYSHFSDEEIETLACAHNFLTRAPLFPAPPYCQPHPIHHSQNPPTPHFQDPGDSILQWGSEQGLSEEDLMAHFPQ